MKTLSLKNNALPYLLLAVLTYFMLNTTSRPILTIPSIVLTTDTTTIPSWINDLPKK